MSNTLELLYEFVNKTWQYNNGELTRNTALEKDLGIKGDDADEFIYIFSVTFNVDITKVDLSNYFNGNDFDFLTSIIRFIKHKPIKKKKELTLGDLEEAIKIGKLEDSIILKYL